VSYKNSSEIVILNKLGKANSEAKADLFETYDQLRDLTVSGPSTAGAGLGTAGSFLFKLAQMLSGSSFAPVLGNQSINIPGTSYYSPIQPGTGIVPGGTAAFGLGPFSQTSGFPRAGSAAGFDPVSILSSFGYGRPNAPNQAFGTTGLPPGSSIAGGAFGLGGVGTGAGLLGAAGFGRNWLMPAAGLVSGIGGLLTTLAPAFGKSALASIATGSILSGFGGSLLSSYQHVSNRILVNADTVLTNKVKNIETVVRMLDAQEEIVKKLLKDSLEGDKKALQDL
jgi:hypothetical protein